MRKKSGKITDSFPEMSQVFVLTYGAGGSKIDIQFAAADDTAAIKATFPEKVRSAAEAKYVHRIGRGST